MVLGGRKGGTGQAIESRLGEAKGNSHFRVEETEGEMTWKRKKVNDMIHTLAKGKRRKVLLCEGWRGKTKTIPLL